MLPDPAKIAKRVTFETGLPFEGRTGRAPFDTPCVEFSPVGHLPSQTFTIRTVCNWRSLQISFEPGTFSGSLVGEMGRADASGRAAFQAVLLACISDGATVELTINGLRFAPEQAGLWTTPWSSLDIVVRKGQLPIGVEEASVDEALIGEWTSRVAVVVTSLLPLEEVEPADGDGVLGFPEGALKQVQVNRYERDRRNRAAALAIHGFLCKACEADLTHIYGEIAEGFIEVHHVTPVSELGDGYVIDPKTDLVPLCPNCHGMTHRRNPPFSVNEMRKMIELQKKRPNCDA